MKRAVSTLMVLLFLLSVLAVTLTVKGEPRIWIVDDDGPADFHTIQEAIGAASNGDTVFVRNGTYYENVIVNETVALVGENREATIVDANQNGDCFNITASGVTVTGFTLRNGGCGPSTAYSCVSIFSNDNNVLGNILTSSWCGVSLAAYCQREVIENNMIENNSNGILGQQLYSVSIVSNDIRSNLIGVWLGPYSISCSVSFNSIADSWAEGLYAYAPSFCTFAGNNITGNNQAGWGSGLTLAFDPFSYGNRFFHNNVANIGQQIELQGATSRKLALDNGYSSGNHWIDYNGSDTNADGIGDTPYIIDSDNQDNYPLIEPYSRYTRPEDINKDGKVDISDIAMVSAAFGSYAGYERWNNSCDINSDGRIDILDLAKTSASFGWHCFT